MPTRCWCEQFSPCEFQKTMFQKQELRHTNLLLLLNPSLAGTRQIHRFNHFIILVSRCCNKTLHLWQRNLWQKRGENAGLVWRLNQRSLCCCPLWKNVSKAELHQSGISGIADLIQLLTEVKSLLIKNLVKTIVEITFKPCL